MKLGRSRGIATLGACLGVAILLASDAQAGWGWGSSGGSSGWGSSSGGSSSSGGYSSSSSGGSSSSGFGLLRRWRHHRVAWRHHHGWGSSSSSSGSSSSSSGGYHHSWGSSSSSGGGSSSSTTYYSAPSYSTPSYAAPAEDAAPAEPPAAELPPQARANAGVLTVSVPEGARVFVNGKQTTSTGEVRQFISRGLESGYQYTYEIRAEYEQDGQTVEQIRTVDLRAGAVASLAFDFAPSAEMLTKLTVEVPEDAKVILSGAETNGSGATRTFTTTRLGAGESWSDYTIVVETERDGRVERQERQITLNAGDSQRVRFTFPEAAQVASR